MGHCDFPVLSSQLSKPSLGNRATGQATLSCHLVCLPPPGPGLIVAVGTGSPHTRPVTCSGLGTLCHCSQPCLRHRGAHGPPQPPASLRTDSMASPSLWMGPTSPGVLRAPQVYAPRLSEHAARGSPPPPGQGHSLQGCTRG